MVFFFIRTMRRQSWCNYLALGLTAGLTLLTRISLITFLPFLVICLYLPLRRELKWGRLAASLGLMVLAIVPWMIRNQAVFGEALLLPTKGGRNLWEYNNQLFTPEKMEGHFTGVDAIYQRFAQKHYDRLQAKELLPFPEFTTESEIERDRILNQRVVGFIRANPGVYVQLCGLRLYQLFRVIPRHLGGPLATLGALISFGWILPASLVGLFLSFKRRWRERSVLYGIIFYTVATATLTASGIPHRMPTDPYFILFAAFCLVCALKLETDPKSKIENPK
jgi:4-amino-4-deoxy-L-arabinose transferase-like glycosyltransferase